MLFCQFAKSQSVRNISNGLRSATGNLNHLGIQIAPSKSTISYQNKQRNLGTIQGVLLQATRKFRTASRFQTDEVQNQIKNIPFGF